MRLPVESHIATLLAFADHPPRIAEYESVARQLGLGILQSELDAGYRMFRGPGFALALLDGFVARLPAVNLLRTPRWAECSVSGGARCVRSCRLRPRTPTTDDGP